MKKQWQTENTVDQLTKMNGSFYKACLLHGPPGIGKTTTVQLVCKELNFDLIELNASDLRNKESIKAICSASNSIVKYTTTPQILKTVILMDEVDGIGGTNDAGGLQELLLKIKETTIPIVCICNDRYNSKIRALAPHTYELEFMKQKKGVIREAMRMVCLQEKIEISQSNLDNLIQSTDFDIRQVLNELHMLTIKVPEHKNENTLIINKSKDSHRGPWDVARNIFHYRLNAKLTLNNKIDKFFEHYELAGLFVHENYLNVQPHNFNESDDDDENEDYNSKVMELIAASADSISMGDLVENMIRQKNDWSMLPLQGVYSYVALGFFMSGDIQQMNFPTCQKMQSRQSDFIDSLKQVSSSMSTKTLTAKESINIDYLQQLKNIMLQRLLTDDIQGAQELVRHYNLSR